MEPSTITLLTVIISGIIWNMIVSSKEKSRPRRLAIVEDSDDDYKMLKMFCDFENTVIDRYKTADNLHLKFIFRKPDAVIADYYLDGDIKGSDVIWLCDKFNIPALLVTGSVGSIEGVSDQRILRKSPDKEYFGKLSTWAQQQLA